MREESVFHRESADAPSAATDAPSLIVSAFVTNDKSIVEFSAEHFSVPVARLPAEHVAQVRVSRQANVGRSYGAVHHQPGKEKHQLGCPGVICGCPDMPAVHEG